MSNDLLETVGKTKEIAVFELVPYLEQMYQNRFELNEKWFKKGSFPCIIFTGNYAILWKEDKDLKEIEKTVKGLTNKKQKEVQG